MILWIPVLLATQMSEDDRAFMRRLFDEYQEMIMRQIWRKVPAQDVEDVFGDVMTRLVPHIALLRGLDEAGLRAYIYSATRSQISDYYRKRKAERKHIAYMPDDDLETKVDPSVDVDQALLYEDQVRSFRRATRQLSEADRQLLEWRIVQKLDFEEIARRLEISVEAARKRMDRARKRLREMMGEEG